MVFTWIACLILGLVYAANQILIILTGTFSKAGLGKALQPIAVSYPSYLFAKIIKFKFLYLKLQY